MTRFIKTGLKLQAAAEQLSENKEKMDAELLGPQGLPVDVVGYHFFDTAKTPEKMRPSLTLSGIFHGMNYGKVGSTRRVDAGEDEDEIGPGPSPCGYCILRPKDKPFQLRVGTQNLKSRPAGLRDNEDASTSVVSRNCRSL